MSNKTWETLFQLSNFMKYLASDVIPYEASPPSAYILNSLFDLLNVTLQTIQVIKKTVPDSSIYVQKNFHKQLESQASKALRSFQSGNSNPSETNKTNVREKSPTQTVQSKADKTVNSFPVGTANPTEYRNYAQIVGQKKNLNKNGVAHDNNERRGSQTSDEVALTLRNASKPSGDFASQGFYAGMEKNATLEANLANEEKSKTDLVHGGLKAVCSGQGSGVVIHQSLVLKKNFIFLNEQVFSGGETFGSFCLPCDKCFIDIDVWNSHSESDPVHLERITKGNYEGIICQKCAFIVFGSFAIGSVYFDYHCKLHSDKESNVEETELSKINAKSDVQNKANLKESFINFNYKVHTERIKESFFCHPCDQFGFDKLEWSAHMLSGKHVQRMASKKRKNVEAICDNCFLRCVALKNKVDRCMSHHALGHSRPLSYTVHPVDHDMYQDLLDQEGFFEFTKPQAFQDSKSAPQEQKVADNNEKPFKNGNICKSPLTESFINFDNEIHLEKIRDAFYCHPCDKFSFIPSIWESHLSSKLHLKTTANQKLVKAVCNQCTLTCILLEEDVATCMSHHYLGHSPMPDTSREHTASTYQIDKLDPLKPVSKVDKFSKVLPENKPNQKEKRDKSVNNKASNETSISKSFIDFDYDVHMKRFDGAFFCHPCHKFGFCPSDWENHSSYKSHVLCVVKKAWEALCTYCSLIFVGEQEQVKLHMIYHSLGHGQPESFTSKKVGLAQDLGLAKTLVEESPVEPSNESTTEFSSNPLSDCTPTLENSQQPETASSEEKNPADIIQYLTRRKLKDSAKEPHFGGYCIPCQLTFEDALDWIDHLDSAAHLAIAKPGEKQIIFDEYSLSIFGNKNNIRNII